MQSACPGLWRVSVSNVGSCGAAVVRPRLMQLCCILDTIALASLGPRRYEFRGLQGLAAPPFLARCRDGHAGAGCIYAASVLSPLSSPRFPAPLFLQGSDDTLAPYTAAARRRFASRVNPRFGHGWHWLRLLEGERRMLHQSLPAQPTAPKHNMGGAHAAARTCRNQELLCIPRSHRSLCFPLSMH